MQVHTFIADSAEEAVERIRTELGPAAVVLSVRKLPRTGLERFLKQEQIEVRASVEAPAVDAPPTDPLMELREEIRQLRQQVEMRSSANFPDPERLPRGRADRKPAGIAHLLTKTGLLPAFAEVISQEVPEGQSLLISEQVSLAGDLLRKRWRGETPGSEAAVHIFVGVPGSGKSTTLCKMLAQTSLIEAQPATVYQLDSHVANTSVLPSVYSEIVGAQFERIVPLNFERREESVFVDLPGVSLQNQKGLDQLHDFIRSFGVPEVHLVLNAAYESSHLLEQVRFFSSVGISDLIVTHLDEESRWGKVWNLVLGTNYGIRSLGCGQNIPGDILPANPSTILARQFRAN